MFRFFDTSFEAYVLNVTSLVNTICALLDFALYSMFKRVRFVLETDCLFIVFRIL